MSILVLLICIGIQIYLTSKKVSPFLSLLLVAILAGLCLGMEPSTLIKSIEKGVGSTLGGLVLIVCLGSVLGKILEVSGAAECITSSLIKAFGIKYIQWAVMIAGICIGIPLYYNAGFVILIPLIFMITRKTNLPLLYIALPMAASLSVTHCFLPPHPGPVLLVNTFHADMGLTLLYGLIIGIPAIIIGGPILGRYFKNYTTALPHLFEKSDHSIANQSLPSLGASIVIALLPVVLITISVIAQYALHDGLLKSYINFVGDSTIALLLTVLLALYLFGIKKNIEINVQMNWISEAISAVSMVLLIITSGGVFKQVLIDSGTADTISSISSRMQIHPLIFGWLVTAMIRLAIGSATVSGITAAGIVTPLLTNNATIHPELMVLAIGAGSVFGSHINDSGFWMFKEYLGLSIKETFLSWSLMESVIAVIGLIGVLLLDLVI